MSLQILSTQLDVLEVLVQIVESGHDVSAGIPSSVSHCQVYNRSCHLLLFECKGDTKVSGLWSPCCRLLLHSISVILILERNNAILTFSSSWLYADLNTTAPCCGKIMNYSLRSGAMTSAYPALITWLRVCVYFWMWYHQHWTDCFTQLEFGWPVAGYMIPIPGYTILEARLAIVNKLTIK